MTDPIADMLVRIKNAQAAKKEAVSFPYSKIKDEIAAILQRSGWIGSVEKHSRKTSKILEINLLYEDGAPKISEAKRISKLSKRVYRGYRKIYSVRKGLGLAVYSTPKGLKTDKEARAEKIGGEILFEIW